MFSKKSRGAKVRRPRQNVGREMVLFKKPPMLGNYEMGQNFRFRFTTVANALRTQISYHDLTDLFLMAVTTVLGYKVFTCVKVKAVEIWDDDVAGGNGYCEVTFSNTDSNQIDDPQVFQDTSIGISPAHVLAKPKKDSLTSKWHGDSGNNAFAITCSANAIVDVVLQMKNLPGTTLPASNALVGAVVGLVYFRGLDGLAIATTNFSPPVGSYRI